MRKYAGRSAAGSRQKHLQCSKPHISNGPVNDKEFSQKAIMASSVVITRYRLAAAAVRWYISNLKAVWQNAVRLSMTSFHVRYRTTCRQQIAIINSRCEFLYEKSHFFENAFLVYRKV